MTLKVNVPSWSLVTITNYILLRKILSVIFIYTFKKTQIDNKDLLIQKSIKWYWKSYLISKKLI